MRKSSIVSAGLLLAALGGGGCARLGSGRLADMSPLPPGFQRERGPLPPGSSPEAYNAQAARQQQRGMAANAPGMAGDTEPGMFSRMKSAVAESRPVRGMSAAFQRKPAAPSTSTVVSQDDPTSLSSRQPGPDAAAFLSLAELHEKSGDFRAAQDQYRKVLATTPNHLQALLGMARLHDRQGEFEEATRLYERAVQQHPKSGTAFNDLGLCYARQQKLDRSVDALTQAIRLQPDRKLYRNNIATVLVEQDRLPDAYDHLAAVHPPAVAHYNLGFLLSQATQPAEAVRQFDMALAKDPGLEAAREWRDVLAGQLAAERSAAPAAASAEDFVPDASEAYGAESSAAESYGDNFGTNPSLRAPSTSRPAPRAGRRREAAPAPETGLQRLPEIGRQQARRPTRDETAAAPPLPDAIETYDAGQPTTADAGYRPPSRW